MNFDTFLETTRFALGFLLVLANIAVWYGVWLERESSPPEVQQKGWRILVRGLAAETAIGLLLFAADTSIGVRQTAQIASATQDAANLVNSFGSLHDFVTNQENLNAAARRELQRSTDSLIKARNEALAAAKDAKQTAASIAAANAPRPFSKEQHDRLIALVKQLPAIPTSQIVFDSVVGNREAKRYAGLIRQSFSDAKLNLLDIPIMGLSNCLECVGVWVCVQANALPKVVEDGKALRDVLANGVINDARFCTDPQNQLYNSSTIKIIVGPKS